MYVHNFSRAKTTERKHKACNNKSARNPQTIAHRYTHAQIYLCMCVCVCGQQQAEMRIAIKNEWPKESNCKRSKAKNCTINKTMAETVERQMEKEGIQEKIGREKERQSFWMCASFYVILICSLCAEKEKENRGHFYEPQPKPKCLLNP